MFVACCNPLNMRKVMHMINKKYDLGTIYTITNFSLIEDI